MLQIGATVTLTRENTVQQFTPWIRLEADRRLTPVPLHLPDGRALLFEDVSASEHLARLRITGFNFPIVPARAILTVSVKPAIALVWLGAVLIFVGGCLAVLRRRWETPVVRAPLPQPGGWGQRIPGWRGTYR
jgi:cytochrome c-type biogenesis protein CcmF